MQTRLHQFRSEIAAEVILIDAVPQRPAHDRRHDVLVDISADERGPTHRPERFESSSLPFQTKPLHQALEVLADGVIAANVEQPMLVFGQLAGIAGMTAAGQKDERGIDAPRRLRSPGPAEVNRIPNPIRQPRDNRLPILGAARHRNPLLSPERVRQQRRAIIRSIGGEQRQQALSIDVRVEAGLLSLGGLPWSSHSLGFGQDHPQLIDRPRSIPMLGIGGVTGLVDGSDGRRVEIVAVVRGSHEMLARGMVEAGPDQHDVPVHGGQAPPTRLGCDLPKHLARARIVRRGCVEVGQRHADRDRPGQVPLKLKPTLGELDRGKLAGHEPALLACQIEVDGISHRESLPADRCIPPLGPAMPIPPEVITLLRVGGEADDPSGDLLLEISALVPGQREGLEGERRTGDRLAPVCGNGCDNRFHADNSFAYPLKVKHNVRMDNIPDKDEVADSNSAEPIPQIPCKSKEIGINHADSPRRNNRVKPGIVRQTSAEKGVTSGVTSLPRFPLQRVARERGAA